ncbi:MAG: formylmethanofuran dehydrogenase subunit B [Isosphaeraceae bacterium]
MPTIHADVPNAELRIVKDATCTFCGCLCDDITLRAEGDRIVEARNACGLGESWFLKQTATDLPACLIEGQHATLDEGIERAARILLEARYPLIFGLDETTSEAQRLAVRIADRVGGCIDTTTDNCYGAPVIGFQELGEVTCTLGEIRNRGDLIIFWGSDPVESHPRHFERYSLMPGGTFVSRGREDRYCVVVDTFASKTAEAADQFIPIKAGQDFESFWVLLALAKGIELDAARVEEETGVPLTTWQTLMDRMKQASYGVILYGGNSMSSPGNHLDTHALLALVRSMNDHTRFVCMRMIGRGNPKGAENVLTWLTGYPYAVNLSRGYPRYGPGEYNAATILERGECDAAMTLGFEAIHKISAASREHLVRIPRIAVGPSDAASMPGWSVEFHTATYGINTPGTVYRMDGVPIPLRPAIESPSPTQDEVLRAIEKRVRAS